MPGVNDAWGGKERREHIRVPASLDVRYKFLSHSASLGPEGDAIHEGRTINISVGGLLMLGKIPEKTWIEGLLARSIVVGANVYLPKLDMPVKVLCRVAWLEAGTQGKYAIGLEFREIATDSLDAVKRFIISKSLPEG